MVAQILYSFHVSPYNIIVSKKQYWDSYLARWETRLDMPVTIYPNPLTWLRRLFQDPIFTFSTNPITTIPSGPDIHPLN